MEKSNKQLLSIKHHVNNHNWVMVRLHELGVETKRNDTLQRMVRTLLKEDYQNPNKIYASIDRISMLLKQKHGLEIKRSELVYLVGKSRIAKNKWMPTEANYVIDCNTVFDAIQTLSKYNIRVPKEQIKNFILKTIEDENIFLSNLEILESEL